MVNDIQNIALILAAGRGQRAGAGLPKTYRVVEGVPVLRRAIETYLNHPKIDHVQVVIHPDDLELYQSIIIGINLPKPAFGGATRATSVANGLNAISKHSPQNVLIHDGARPFVSAEVISRVIEKLSHFDGAIPALPSTDALWQANGDQLQTPLDRSQVLRAQTPQGFRYESYAPIANQNPDALDDAQIAVSAELNVGWVMGDIKNVKLTFKEDFE